MVLSEMSGSLLYLVFKTIPTRRLALARWEQLESRWTLEQHQAQLTSGTCQRSSWGLEAEKILSAWLILIKGFQGFLVAASENLRNAIDSTLNGACFAALGASKFQWGIHHLRIGGADLPASWGLENRFCFVRRANFWSSPPWGWSSTCPRTWCWRQQTN